MKKGRRIKPALTFTLSTEVVRWIDAERAGLGLDRSPFVNMELTKMMLEREAAAKKGTRR
jgi:hypothetical protein